MHHIVLRQGLNLFEPGHKEEGKKEDSQCVEQPVL